MKKAALIISVYKNTRFLRAVLDALRFQTEQNFELIITEDGNDPTMQMFIENYPFHHPHLHLTQEDLGWRKNKALNNAIRAASAPWLIFIDGDCILHPRFIEMHLRYAEKNTILAGKRVKLNSTLTDWLLHDINNLHLMPGKIRKYLFKKAAQLRFIEEGIFINPDRWLGFIPRMRKLNRLKGCNMSFSKEAIEAINGFDEDYVNPAVGEDADITWRFKSAGYHFQSLRNLAVQYHLYHPENWSDQSINLQLMQDKQSRNEYICQNGLTPINSK